MNLIKYLLGKILIKKNIPSIYNIQNNKSKCFKFVKFNNLSRKIINTNQLPNFKCYEHVKPDFTHLYKFTETLKDSAKTFKDDFSKHFVKDNDLNLNDVNEDTEEHIKKYIHRTNEYIYLCKIKASQTKKILTSSEPVFINGNFINNENDNINKNSVNISIPANESIVRIITVPTMKDSHFKNALKSPSLWGNYRQLEIILREYSIFYQVIRRKRSCRTMDVLFIASKLSNININNNGNEAVNNNIVDPRCFIVNSKIASNSDNTWPTVFVKCSYEENYAMVIDGDRCSIFEISLSEDERKIISSDDYNGLLTNKLARNFAQQLHNIICDYEEDHKVQGIRNILFLSSSRSSSIILDRIRFILTDYDISECNFLDRIKTIDEYKGAFSLKNLLLSFKRHPKNNSNLPTAYSYNNIYNPLSRFLKGSFALSSAFASIAIIALMFSTYQDLDLDNKTLSNEVARLSYINEEYNIAKSTHDSLAQIQNIIEEAENSQNKLISVYNYLNLVTLDDIWLKEINYIAPDTLEISGGSYTDGSIIEFMDLLSEGEQFDTVSLRKIKSVREVSMNNARPYNIKKFRIDSVINNNPEIYQDNNNLVAHNSNDEF